MFGTELKMMRPLLTALKENGNIHAAGESEACQSLPGTSYNMQYGHNTDRDYC